MPKKVKLKLENLSVKSFKTNEPQELKGGYDTRLCHSDAQCMSDVRVCSWTAGNNFCYDKPHKV